VQGEKKGKGGGDWSYPFAAMNEIQRKGGGEGKKKKKEEKKGWEKKTVSEALGKKKRKKEIGRTCQQFPLDTD